MKGNHCWACPEYDRFLRRDDVPGDCKRWLNELWWMHQDMSDNILCWNAYMTYNDPSQIVKLDEE